MGILVKIFIKNAKKKGATISFIKTRKGRRFGGFTKAEWTDEKGWITLKYENAFLFSLDNKEKFDIIKSDSAIRCIPDDYCSVFGNNFDCSVICIKNKFLINDKSYEDHKTNVYNIPSNHYFSGEKNFYVKEIEVYQIIF